MLGRERFLAAARGEAVDTTPVWMMRQAGRFLPEYRAIREKVSFLELCGDVALATEVTLQPVRRLGVDAAIIFSDILVPIPPMGLELTFGKGHGPMLAPPVRTRDAVEALLEYDVRAEVGHVGEIVASVRKEVGDSTAVIGFAGAPFTMMAYMVQGQGSRSFELCKKMLFSDPELAEALLHRLSDVVIEYLRMQIDAGADAVQLFDTWAGLLGPEDFDRFAARPAARILGALEGEGVVRTYFPKGAGCYLDRAAAVPFDMLGVDWRTSLAHAGRAVGSDRAVQGNLDPTVLLGTPAELEGRVRAMMEAGATAGGHVANLGHGVLPPTDPDMGLRFVELVHELGAKG